jgi:solute carrier family 25 S-adenosylmethionine transporter 26
VARDIPCSVIQFVLYERLRDEVKDMRRRRGRPQSRLDAEVGGGQESCGGGRATSDEAAEGALCGFVSGGIAAACTTPFDVAKTRIMLGQSASGSLRGAVSELYAQRGARGLFAGLIPRVASNAVGGMLWLGFYAGTAQALRNHAGWG